MCQVKVRVNKSEFLLLVRAGPIYRYGLLLKKERRKGREEGGKREGKEKEKEEREDLQVFPVIHLIVGDCYVVLKR